MNSTTNANSTQDYISSFNKNFEISQDYFLKNKIDTKNSFDSTNNSIFNFRNWEISKSITLIKNIKKKDNKKEKIFKKQKTSNSITNVNDIFLLKKEEKEKLKIKKIKKKRKRVQKGCFCKSKDNHCLRKSCLCFKYKGFCSPECKCQNCLNTEKYEKLKQKIIRYSNFIQKSPKNDEIENFVIIDNVKINKKGCKCKKGDCQKNYCSCYKLGTVCSSICICCEGCENDKKILSQDLVRKYIVKRRKKRKRHKIVIDYDNKEVFLADYAKKK